MDDYEVCPWCGHRSWHKNVACDCCAGCDEEVTSGGFGTPRDCDCQRTQDEIADRNAGIFCYAVLGNDGECAEHNAPWMPRVRDESWRCEKWRDGPAPWRSEDGKDPMKSE